MKRFQVPIFGPTIHYTDCPDEAIRWINRNAVDLKQGEYEGFTATDGKTICLFAPTPGILAHEALHAAVMVLDHIGAEQRDEEVTAYLIQFIFEKCAA
jgi:hypothetical protein